jgi:hypothetical protein
MLMLHLVLYLVRGDVCQSPPLQACKAETDDSVILCHHTLWHSDTPAHLPQLLQVPVGFNI